ncbi:hypothetical protein AQUCO_00500386v1 [Aquilegia coerulea]|uniref:J domain-containing protein n=1 Tax=Aquilegia coerulea TaxID=218851 RepID=A0A2G5ERR2_AQUCA|nr:hypothetical protein AQUCO_00500386v1 [Aquilegia coerulea]
MDDFPGLLARDFGFRAQGKAAPMAASKGTSGGNLNFGMGSGGDGRSSSFSSSSRGKSNWNSTPSGSSFLDDDGLFRSSASQKNHDSDGLGGYNDVYGGPPKYTNQSNTRNSATFDYDAVFQGSKGSSGAKSSLPVYDKPVYDDDIFDGVPGMKSTSSVKYDDVFSSISSPPKQKDHFDDFLGNLDRKEPAETKSSYPKTSEVKKDVSDFDDLLPGFGGSSPPKNRGAPEASHQQKPTAAFNKSTNVMDDPFVIIEPGSVPPYETSEIFDDPLEQVKKSNKPASTNFNGSPGSGVFNDMNPLDDFANSVPSFSSGAKNRVENKSPSRTGANASSTQRATSKEPTEDPFFRTANNASPKVEMSPKYEVDVDSVEDIWITVSEVPLFTQPTSAPPPSRPPPPRPVQVSRADESSLSARNAKEKINQYSSFQHFSPSFQSPTAVPSSGKSTGVSSIDELEDFAMGRSRDPTDDPADVLSGEEGVDTSAAAAAKVAVDRAEAKFKHAREVRERESVRTGRSKETGQQEKDEKASRDSQERELREKQERLDREREQREREEKEREQKRLEKEKERARQAVERATREVRERAAAEARTKAQKAAVEKATAEARERAERAAVQRALAEARERAAKEAREKLERAAAEARERSNAEAKEKAAAVARAENEVRMRAERASVDRATAEARERASAEARERASASTRHSQQNSENDLESFFSMGARPSSAPRPNRTSTSDSAFDSQFQNRPVPEGARRTPSTTSSTIRKASSTTNIVDDLTSIFGGASPSGEFQEMDGESEERRKARLERHQRTQERATKALAEKNERDRQIQREQAERNRISETLDIEIKRWSAGKEGNLRALLSTLQYVLWPECGWQPISLTDLITGAAVKKAYRKATLCIHPDKVQQKGATLQQKYIAEKVFDLLKVLLPIYMQYSYDALLLKKHLFLFIYC